VIDDWILLSSSQFANKVFMRILGPLSCSDRLLKVAQAPLRNCFISRASL